ncbi:TPA: DUF4433 domain-containing protein [Yersinia enterocolitica]|nr:DUF4433 domain-containing protein [Yersinia enterocolitica]
MTLPEEHLERYVYHFTHINNIPELLVSGLLSNSQLEKHNLDVTSIAEPDIQARRAAMAVTCGPCGVVHDYVPFYFSTRSPMLLGVVNKRNVDQFDIIYLEYKLSTLIKNGFVFTDSSANASQAPNFYSDLNKLSILDWNLIDSLSWGTPNGRRQEKMAEFLVHGNVSIYDAENIVVWNERIKKVMLQYIKGSNVNAPTISFENDNRRHYFTNFMHGGQSSCTYGPKETAGIYSQTYKNISERDANNIGGFANIDAILVSLREDLNNISYTKELVGLSSDNGIHKKTVDQHTHDVVRNVTKSSYFSKLNERCKIIVELSAFLHDIGKGPKSRWGDGLQKVDTRHPVLAMHMLKDLFMKQVINIDLNEIKILLKLVCYHDLIGDILGNGRDEVQLIQLVETEEEVNMLFCLSEADITSLVPIWWDKVKVDALYKRTIALLS